MKVGIDDVIFEMRQRGLDGEELKKAIEKYIDDGAVQYVPENEAKEVLRLTLRDIEKNPASVKKILFTEYVLDCLATVSDLDQQRFFNHVEAIPGIKKGWKTELKKAVKATKKKNALPWDPAPAALASMFGDDVDFPHEAADLVMPCGVWKTGPDGLYKFDAETGDYEQICFAPLVLTRRLVDIETGAEKLEAALLRDGRWRKISAERSTFADPRRLISLADQGLPVTSATASDVVRWLAELEAANRDEITVSACVERFGWMRNDAFILGNIAHHESGNQEITFVTSDSNLKNAVEALQPGGTLNGWIGNIKTATAGRPKLALVIAAAFVAPLLKIIECDNFFLDIPGRSSSGKTSAAILAASAWGYCGRNRPATLFRPVNTTRVGLENQAAAFCDLPLVLDDTHALTVNILSELVYMVCNGIGKSRGKRTGGNQRMKTWRTVAISTGEAALEDCSTWTGARARVLTVRDPWGGSCGDTVREAVAQVNEHYGHAGREFINWLIDNKAKWSELREKYRVFVKTLAKRCSGNAVAERRAGYFVAIYMVADLVEKLFGFNWDMLTEREKFNALFDEIVIDGSNETTGKLGLDAVRDFVSANWAYFEGVSNQMPGKVLGKVVVGEYVGVFATELREELKRRGFNPGAVIKELEERGIMRCRVGVKMQAGTRHLNIIDWRYFK